MEDYVEDAAMTIAKLMCASARTAPKAKATDDITISIVPKEKIGSLADKMQEISCEKGWAFYLRDSKNVLDSDAIVLIGARNRPMGLECGGCGHDCKTLLELRKENADFPGPVCVFKSMDLGIALSSAAKTASMHNADNRMMYTVGVAAMRLGLIEGDIAIGIPISIKGKNIYFDRKM
ncbi:MAG TPA: DUF2148 domain-containing protein [Candidatus Methanofastidiosa archaeon]|nr:DUF2148 domain-containing protein [Candidatus Methanofastidiosa archaeon]